MEDISPSLLLILDVRTALENGSSVRTGVLSFIQNSQSSFSEIVSIWLLKLDQRQDPSDLYSTLHPCRRSLLTLLEKGLLGNAILPHLMDFEKEVIRSCEAELEEHIQKLPLKLMLPVLFFMFPAYLILLIGPILLALLNSL